VVRITDPIKDSGRLRANYHRNLAGKENWSKDFVVGDTQTYLVKFQIGASQACIVDDCIDLLIPLP
jgi:hypothetical protein